MRLGSREGIQKVGRGGGEVEDDTTVEATGNTQQRISVATNVVASTCVCVIILETESR